jgi:hypothetical protein
MVCIDHGVFLHHSWALSVVLQGLRQPHASSSSRAEPAGNFWETGHPVPCGFDFASQKPVSRELAHDRADR